MKRTSSNWLSNLLNMLRGRGREEELLDRITALEQKLLEAERSNTRAGSIIAVLKNKISAMNAEKSELQEQNSLLSKELAAKSIDLDSLKNFVAPPKPPKLLGEISNTEICHLFAEVFPDCSSKLFISDAKYQMTTISEVRRFLMWSKTDMLRYRAEFLDCDDFSDALAGEFSKSSYWSGIPVGTIWGSLYGGHSFCVVVAYPSEDDLTPTVYYVEPQDDSELAAEIVEDMHLWLLKI